MNGLVATGMIGTESVVRSVTDSPCSITLRKMAKGYQWEVKAYGETHTKGEREQLIAEVLAVDRALKKKYEEF
jgi:hypothetical protein|tara:strand:+ start:1751 stop:1969 length:219 start_codon:yes stop_codon:yes gene_type:complete